MKQSTSSPKQAVLAELSEAAGKLRFDVLLSLLSFTGALTTDKLGRLTPGTVRRAHTRWLVLRLYADRKRHPMTKGWSAGRLNRLVVAEAKSQFPGVKVAESTLRRWIDIWNKPGDDGLALGAESLIDFRGRPRQPRRRRRRSP